MPGKFAPSKGDWVCCDSRCGNLNFARRDKCNKCGRPKRHNQGDQSSSKEIGKEFAEKSRGLFVPDDWQCKSCGNVNWARRSVCNVCNVTRVNTQGRRTGYGGGYMERDEVVDYKRHDESDDEFNEFGLKKKKFRKTQGNGDEVSAEKMEKREPETLTAVVKEMEKGKKENLVESENEEEEESGNDEDLAKYDICGDDDDNEGDDTESKSPTAEAALKRGKASNNDRGGTEKETILTKRVRTSSQSSSESSSSSSDADSSSSSSSNLHFGSEK